MARRRITHETYRIIDVSEPRVSHRKLSVKREGIRSRLGAIYLARQWAGDRRWVIVTTAQGHVVAEFNPGKNPYIPERKKVVNVPVE